MAEKSSLSPCIPATNHKATDRKKLFELSPKKSLSPVKKFPMMQLVVKAIEAVGLPRKGASLTAIKKWIIANSDSTSNNQAALKKAILKGIESGIIVRSSQSKNAHGISGSFTLSSKPKKKATGDVIAKHPKLNEKPLKAPKKLKEKDTAQDMTVVKKESGRKTKPLTDTIENNSNVKKEPKNPVSSKVSKKEIKKATPPTKLSKKKNVKTTSTPEVQKNGIADVGSDSNKQNVKYPEQESTKEENANTTNVKQGKVTVARELKTNALQNAVRKREVKQKKVKKDKINIKAKENDHLKTNGEPLKQSDIQALSSTSFEKTEIRKDASDTELDTKHDCAKSRKSYASDTELEVSRRMVYKNKKTKTSRKALVKKATEKGDETA